MMSEAQEKLERLKRLSDDELLEMAWAELSALCGAKGRPKKWRMTVPVDADNDSDILFGEVLMRYAKLKSVRDAARHVASVINTIRQVMVKDHAHKEVFGGTVYLVDHSQMWVLVRNAEDLDDALADTQENG